MPSGTRCISAAVIIVHCASLPAVLLCYCCVWKRCCCRCDSGASYACHVCCLVSTMQVSEFPWPEPPIVRVEKVCLLQNMKTISDAHTMRLLYASVSLRCCLLQLVDTSLVLAPSSVARTCATSCCTWWATWYTRWTGVYCRVQTMSRSSQGPRRGVVAGAIA